MPLTLMTFCSFTRSLVSSRWFNAFVQGWGLVLGSMLCLVMLFSPPLVFVSGLSFYQVYLFGGDHRHCSILAFLPRK